MKKEDTKQRILKKALELFSSRGYDSVSVGEIAKAVGIKAPSLYNHFESKQAIFDAIVEETTAQYEKYTSGIEIHMHDSNRDIPLFSQITEDMLIKKVHEIFNFSLHNEAVSRFRRMITIEQFRSPALSSLYSQRYVERLTAYHAEIFQGLIAKGELISENADALAIMYVAPIMTFINICDRQPGREEECLKKLDTHVALFFRTFHARSQISGKATDVRR